MADLVHPPYDSYVQVVGLAFVERPTVQTLMKHPEKPAKLTVLPRAMLYPDSSESPTRAKLFQASSSTSTVAVQEWIASDSRSRLFEYCYQCVEAVYAVHDDIQTLGESGYLSLKNQYLDDRVARLFPFPLDYRTTRSTDMTHPSV